MSTDKGGAMLDMLLRQKKECEDAIYVLMLDERQEHLYVRGVLEDLITRIETQIKYYKDEP